MKASAIALLSSRLAARHADARQKTAVDSRRSQIGSGERSDKIRTVQMQNGQVVNHRNDKKINVERYLKGDLAAIL